MKALYSLAAACAAVLVAQTVATPTQAAPYDRLYVFGDSLLDGGNLYALTGVPTSPPYAQRFTDGPTSIEYYASGAGLSLTHSANPNAAPTASLNFAVSGALTDTRNNIAAVNGTTGLINQVADFGSRVQTGAVRFDPATTLFFVEGGGNDILRAVYFGDDPNTLVDRATANVRAEINDLVASGARHVALATYSDLSYLPTGRASSAEQAALLGSLSTGLSAAYVSLAGELRAQTGRDVFSVDLGGLYNAVYADPAAYGFTNGTDACVSPIITPTSVCADPASYVYWDRLHPTTAVHRIVGEGLTAALAVSEVPEPVSAALLVPGLAGLVLLRRRRA